VVRDLPSDPGPHERLLTVREVASRLGVSTALVYRLCERNELRSLRIGVPSGSKRAPSSRFSRHWKA